ncbi:hypothetical protein SH611_20750 [Geminicoccaceae bacterium 1502E]|nr:hypothetical protein [Geminicoccaceae bacterium 1502E]
MASVAGCDVSEQATEMCVVEGEGMRARGRCPTDPVPIRDFLAEHAPDRRRLVIETGSLIAWLVHGLRALPAPVVCACARQAHAAVSRGAGSHGPRKTDRGGWRGWRQSPDRWPGGSSQ